MANTSYPKGAEKILGGAVNMLTDTLKVALLPSTYTYSTSHEFLDAVGTRVGTDQVLTGKSIAGGVFDANDVDFGAFAPGSSIRSLAIYKDTGNASTSPLLLFFDIVTGLPMTTNGGGVTIPWDNSAKKIARLGAPFYPKGAEKVLSGAYNLGSAGVTLRAALLPSTYVYDGAHEFLADIGTLVGAAQPLVNKTITGGVFDAEDINFGQTTGAAAGSVVVYVDTGTATTSPLLMYITSVVGLPYTPNGGGLRLEWSQGAARIVSLVPA